jgi:fructose-1,6-bisphosphatase/inositol monophosphatase family enzyme
MDERVKVATYAILTAGVVIMKFDPVTVGSTVKSTVGDFVTDADVESEQIIEQIIKINYPNEIVISEGKKEGHHLIEPINISSFTGWVIDPIDGTNNYKKACLTTGYQ